MKTTTIRKRKSIIIQYRIDGIQFRIYTGISVNDSEWNEKSKVVNSKNQSYLSINQTILKIKVEIETFIFDLKRTEQKYKHEDLKAHINDTLHLKTIEDKQKGLYYAFDLFISKKSPKYSPLTIRAYKNTLSHIRNFIGNNHKKVAFEKLNKDWFDKFTNYLKTELNHSPSMRGKQIKTIKAVLNFAFEEGLHNETKYRLIKKETEYSANVYLSEKEIDLLIKTQYEKIDEEKMIDAFVFICFTGLRFSDYDRISKENFKLKEKYWHINFQQYKTKTMVRVPIIYKSACDILKKYEFELPKYSNAYFNRGLKAIFKKYKLFTDDVILHKEQKNGAHIKNTLISLHTGRRSFATNQFLKNTPTNLIMAATGHESEKAFRLYIKADEIEKAKNLILYADY